MTNNKPSQKNVCQWWRGEVSHVLRILFSSLHPTNEFQYLALCLDALGLRPHFKNLCWSWVYAKFCPCVFICWSTAKNSGLPSSYRDADLASCLCNSVLGSLCLIKGQIQLTWITPGNSPCQMETWRSGATLSPEWLTLPSSLKICPHLLLSRMPHHGASDLVHF